MSNTSKPTIPKTLSIDEILAQSNRSDLLRFTTAGSVDDGKSTLIGRLLHDSKNIYDDHLQAVGKDSKKLGRETTDYALLTDGLKAEREQGITIDVAYRYFSTPKRRFIIADTPGHEQYTRNMATGASTADLAIILIDAQNGVLIQSRRHGFISSLLNIPNIVVAVNKMDLVQWSEERFNQIKADYTAFATRLGLANLTFIPVSALLGDNIVNRSENMPWYQGMTLISHLESVYIEGTRNLVDFRFPVQYVNRPHAEFRGFCGTIASGVIHKGDRVTILPSWKNSKVKEIILGHNSLEKAWANQSVTLTLEDEIDISRGSMIIRSDNQPHFSEKAEAMLVWMNESKLDLQKTYLIKHCSQYVRAKIQQLKYKIDPRDMERMDADTLHLNEIGRATIQFFKPVPYDDYKKNRTTGSFIIIDSLTNNTVAAGMINNKLLHKEEYTPAKIQSSPKSLNIVQQKSYVAPEERWNLLQQRPKVLWLTGLSGSGKSTIAYTLEKLLTEQKHPCFVLDGDNIRHGLCRDLGFSAGDRSENIRRVAEVAKLMQEAGLFVITAFISPYIQDRMQAKTIIGEDNYLEVFVNTPLEICEKRDVKGLYKKARSGEIGQFTGISSPFERPEQPDLIIDTVEQNPTQSANLILTHIFEEK